TVGVSERVPGAVGHRIKAVGGLKQRRVAPAPVEIASVTAAVAAAEQRRVGRELRDVVGRSLGIDAEIRGGGRALPSRLANDGDLRRGAGGVELLRLDRERPLMPER